MSDARIGTPLQFIALVVTQLQPLVVGQWKHHVIFCNCQLCRCDHPKQKMLPEHFQATHRPTRRTRQSAGHRSRILKDEKSTIMKIFELFCRVQQVLIVALNTPWQNDINTHSRPSNPFHRDICKRWLFSNWTMSDVTGITRMETSKWCWFTVKYQCLPQNVRKISCKNLVIVCQFKWYSSAQYKYQCDHWRVAVYRHSTSTVHSGVQ